MDIKPVGNNNAQSGPRVTDTASFSLESPAAAAARQGAAPVQTVNAVQQAAELPTMRQVEEAVKTVNQAMKSLSRNLEFSVDEKDRTIVKVIDQQTKEVIRQIPTPEAMEISKALDRVQGMLLKQQA
jgi:flagellar protein FlaG